MKQCLPPLSQRVRQFLLVGGPEHVAALPAAAARRGGGGRGVALLLQAGLRHTQGRRRGEAAGPAVKEVEGIVLNRVFQRFTSGCKKFR